MKRIKQIERGLAAVAAATVLAACSSTPERTAEIDRARTAIQGVEASPDAGRFAAQAVTDANEALRRAERLAEDGEKADAASAAYVARRHAGIARQQIARGQAEATTRAAEAEREQVLARARQQEAVVAQAQAQAARARAQAAQASAERAAAVARADARALQEQLHDLQARQTPRGMVLTLSDVLFETDSAMLKPGAESTISRLAEFLHEAERRSVTIEGHTDSIGTDSYNQQLSEQRADAVKAALTAEGIAASRVVTEGMGEQVPIAGNDTAAGRQQNRRVEIIISDATEEAGG